MIVAQIRELVLPANDLIAACTLDENTVRVSLAKGIGMLQALLLFLAYRILTYGHAGPTGELSLRMTPFDRSKIKCVGMSEPDQTQCRNPLNHLPPSGIQVFGHRGQANLDVDLPLTLSSGSK